VSHGRPSIVHVARVAGVSRQTVSNVVNERGGFTEATRQRVLDAIATTGYKPNRAARELRSQRSWHIGLPLELGDVDVRDPFTLEFLKAVSNSVRPLGHSLMVYSHDPGDEAAFRAWATGGEADAFVFSNVSFGDYRTALLSSLRLPFMVMGRTAPSEPQTWVDIDNASAMSGLVDYLVGRGRRRMVYLDGGGTEHWVLERVDAVRIRLEKHGSGLPDTALLRGSVAEVAARLDDVLAGPDRPDAVVCGSDALALLASARIQAAGLSVGEDVAVTGFDGGLRGWLVDRTLTTVRIPVERVADALIARLMTLLDGGDVEGLVMPTELVIGTSA